MLAAQKGHAGAVEALLGSEGIEVNAKKEDGGTARACHKFCVRGIV